MSSHLLEQLQELIEHMLNTMEISSNATRIGVVSFAGKPVVDLELQAGNAKKNILEALSIMQELPGKADLMKLAEKVKISFFNNQREGTGKFLVIFVNSEITPDSDGAAKKSIKELKGQDVHTVVVDVGKNNDKNVLDNLVESPEDTNTVRTDDLYSTLATIFDGLKKSSKKGKIVVFPKVLFHNTFQRIHSNKCENVEFTKTEEM